MRALRKGLARANPQAGAQAAERLPAQMVGRFAVVAGYCPIPGEIDPAPLMARLAAAGARLALPATVARDTPLSSRVWRPGEALVPDAFGLAAPTPTAETVEPDLFILPLVAFDRRGGRMGQGGGFYDRTLETVRARRAMFALGLAFAGQEAAHLPIEAHDQRLDAILTESAYMPVQKDL